MSTHCGVYRYLTPQPSRSWRFFADTLVSRRGAATVQGEPFHDRSGRAFSRDNSEGTRDHKYALGMSTSKFDDASLPTCSRRVFLEKTLAGIAMLNATAVIAADDLANLDLHEAATLVRQKKVSPVQFARPVSRALKHSIPHSTRSSRSRVNRRSRRPVELRLKCRAGSGEGRFTVSRSLSRICSTPQAFGRRAAARCSRIEFQARMPLSSNGFAMAGPSF